MKKLLVKVIAQYKKELDESINMDIYTLVGRMIVGSLLGILYAILYLAGVYAGKKVASSLFKRSKYQDDEQDFEEVEE